MAIACFSKVSELRTYCQEQWLPSEKVALVPTMGALHQGHISLVSKAKTVAERVVVSIFVNPTQFGPQEDFTQYPRTLAADLALLEAAGVDLVFAPTLSEVFPPGFQTFVDNVGVGSGLCGQERPGHFRGVCTIVLKLLQMVKSQVAVFGMKDYQQVKVIEAMVADLNLDVAIVRGELKRDDDGLAMSSRNTLLSPEARQLALHLPAGLQAAHRLFVQGERRPQALLATAARALAEAGPSLSLGYLELRRQCDLEAFGSLVDGPAVLLAAVRVGGVRLIDNIELG